MAHLALQSWSQVLLLQEGQVDLEDHGLPMGQKEYIHYVYPDLCFYIRS